jgi:threonylcarbamoyladenosine tRNA methylthiotransferase MtaB
LSSSFRILTFGCKVNQCDSQIIRENLAAWGLIESAAPDLIILNTCTVTAVADAKFRKALRKVRREHPQALIAVTGCFAGRASQKALPEADLVFQPKDLAVLSDFLKKSGNRVSFTDDVSQSYFAEHTRAFLKIQDGCDCFCSYCIVPFVRPYLWSRHPDEAIATINRLSEKGYREVVLTGIHLGFYGRGLRNGAASLHALLTRIERECRIDRVRLSSIEINEVTDDLVELMARSSKICRHFHLPLQSGDNDILKRMNRKYTADFFLNRVEEIRQAIPDIGLSADIIVGFPGETEEQFQRTCEAVDAVKFTKIHVFRYSRRPGTRAAEFNSPVPPNIVSGRARRLIQLGNDAAAQFKERFIGKTLDVLVETYEKKRKVCEGFASNYIRVRFDGGNAEDINKLVPVRLHHVSREDGMAIGIRV